MSELLKVNVNDHTEKKGGLTYLSWAWAWAEALKHDPSAVWTVHTYAGGEEPFMRIGDTAMVHTSVTVKGIRRECMLPVMDNRNKAIKQPDAFAINTSIMRCMTKALAMHGLGLYIYAGEDLPESDESASLEPALQASIDAAKKAKEVAKPRGITPTAGAGDGVEPARKGELEEMALYMIDCHKDGKDGDPIRIWYDAANFESNDERVYVWHLLQTESKLRAVIKANNPSSNPAPVLPRNKTEVNA